MLAFITFDVEKIPSNNAIAAVCTPAASLLKCRDAILHQRHQLIKQLMISCQKGEFFILFLFSIFLIFFWGGGDDEAVEHVTVRRAVFQCAWGE